jgi:predicted component of type VI protein secretion system
MHQLTPTASTTLVWLEATSPQAAGEDCLLAAVTVGRNESRHQILSSRVSREHAEIVREGNVFRVRDLKSTNGTYVNGERISCAPERR